MLSSSIQAELDNPYGISKKAGEDLLIEYGRETGSNVLIYRFPNVFGKWCRPNYNSAVATFCHNVAHDLPIQVNDRSVNMTWIPTPLFWKVIARMRILYSTSPE